MNLQIIALRFRHGVAWNGTVRQMKVARMPVRLKLTLVGVILSTSIVSAQQAVRPSTPVTTRQPASAAAQRATREIKSLINGVAVNGDQTPVPHATVRLRNLAVNAIDQIVTANAAGEFTFVAQPGVAYVVELADQSGRTIAVGDVIVASAGEVAGTKVALPSGSPALAGVYGSTVSSVVSAAIGTGLQVVDPALPKVSPTR
jgi:hypothetical protein